jgi:hypothetical protein
MLYTYKVCIPAAIIEYVTQFILCKNRICFWFQVTVYPGQGQVEPKIFFGSGPTKKDAKFACGTIAWAAIQNPNAIGM